MWRTSPPATSYYNDRVIFYCTNVTLSRNTRRNYEKYYNAVYDRKTGEQVSFWSLFKPDENYMRQWLLVQLEPLDADRRQPAGGGPVPGMALPWVQRSLHFHRGMSCGG